uniref:Uncharacterized protein n=1 Tax=Meloidogyne incognita TaxID=6306 RepID=A0A914MFL0_MELIC
MPVERVLLIGQLSVQRGILFQMEKVAQATRGVVPTIGEVVPKMNSQSIQINGIHLLIAGTTFPIFGTKFPVVRSTGQLTRHAQLFTLKRPTSNCPHAQSATLNRPVPNKSSFTRQIAND